VRGDGRSRRVAVVSDRVVNPPDGDRALLERLGEAGWGLVQLPPDGLDPADRADAFRAVVEALTAFAQEGYALATELDEEERAELLRATGPALGAHLAAATGVR
jgi:hypothetical protein